MSNHDTVNKLQAALFELAQARSKANAYAETMLGMEIVGHLMATQSHLMAIGNGVKPEDLLSKV